MAFKIIWSRQARDDLRDIVSFIGEDSPAVAEKFGFRLIVRVDSLSDFPELGRIVPEENDPHIREIVVRPYRIIYCVQEDQKIVAIVRIWHGARAEPEIPLRLEI